MPAPRLCVGLLALAFLPACDNHPATTGPAYPAPVRTTVAAVTATAATTGTTARATSADGQTVGHIRVSIKKVTVGKVPLKSADGSVTYADEPRLMIALRIENVSDQKRSEYNTWVPDLDAARTVAKLTDDRGAEVRRVTFGFGNNVQGRTVLDTLTPGKVIGDLLVFEAPAAGVKALKLTLPGANCGVKGSFEFDIDATMIRPK
jgi:hypothetical protein